MPQQIGFDYWLQALGINKNLTLGAVNVLSKLKIPHMVKGIILILFLLPRAFLKVTLPLAAPGLVASAVFVFLQSMFEFTGTFFVGLPFVTPDEV